MKATSNFPKIHMLSMIGVRKHYHQDYLINQERTDFAGKNGVGKSIIADLLQLIFVQDRKIIRFGTEGLKKELRKIETIPYKHSQAYVYLTIEVIPGRFLAIGVCIPINSKASLMPFVITKQANISKASLEAISYDKECILKSADLLHDNVVLPINEMSIHLREKFELFFNYYKNKNEIREYHKFLNRYDLVPIDLSKDGNLKSFARVIQSFSKAKEFDPTDSKKLKDFLFEEVAIESNENLNQLKSDLATQLDNYKDLNKSNTDLSAKRSSLKHLKRLEEYKLDAELRWRQTELASLRNNHNLIDKKVTELIKAIDLEHSKQKSIVKKIEKLNSSSIPIANRLVSNANTVNICLAGCSDLQAKYSELIKDEQLLLTVEVPDLTHFEVLEGVNTDDLTISSLYKTSISVIPFISEFSSYKQIENKVLAQEALINELTNETKQEIERLEKLWLIVINNKDNSLFNKVIEKGKSLTLEQESVLFHFIDASWGIPEKITQNAKYVSELLVFDTGSISHEPRIENSFWFSTGALHQLIKIRNEPQLLDNQKNIEAARTTLNEQIKLKLEELKALLIEIDKARAGQEYDQRKLSIKFDLRLVNRLQLQEIAVNIERLRSIETKISQIYVEKDKLNNQLCYRLKSTLLYNKSITIDYLNQLQADWKKVSEHRTKRLENLRNFLVTANNTNNAITNSLKFNKEELSKIQKEVTSLLETILKKHDELVTVCQENYIGEEKIPQVTIEESSNIWNAEIDFKKAQSDYQDYYYSIAYPYIHEGKSNYNAEIEEQTTNKTYKFRVLEENLLRGIGLLENVEGYLSTLNKQRLDCRRTIYEQIKSLFSQTVENYNSSKNSINDLNVFFNNRKIKNRFTFKIEFIEELLSDDRPMIKWLSLLQKESSLVFETSELKLGKSVDEFIEDFYKEISKETEKRSIRDLLDPKSYFSVTARLVNEKGIEVPGSTGEAYTSIVLLGIGRISVISEKNKGIKFVILEETASIDDDNFELVMNIAHEFGYQIITMTPKPYGIGLSYEWYLHQLIPGNEDPEINYPIPASFIRSANSNNQLMNLL